MVNHYQRLESYIKVLCMFDVHHFPRLHLNVNRFTFSCSPGISGMRYTWLMY